MGKVQLPVRIEEETLKELKKLAEKENRSLSNYVDTELKDVVYKRKKFGK